MCVCVHWFSRRQRTNRSEPSQFTCRDVRFAISLSLSFSPLSFSRSFFFFLFCFARVQSFSSIYLTFSPIDTGNHDQLVYFLFAPIPVVERHSFLMKTCGSTLCRRRCCRVYWDPEHHPVSPAMSCIYLYRYTTRLRDYNILYIRLM